jgi:hypothetical protein
MINCINMYRKYSNLHIYVYVVSYGLLHTALGNSSSLMFQLRFSLMRYYNSVQDLCMWSRSQPVSLSSIVPTYTAWFSMTPFSFQVLSCLSHAIAANVCQKHSVNILPLLHRARSRDHLVSRGWPDGSFSCAGYRSDIRTRKGPRE